MYSGRHLRLETILWRKYPHIIAYESCVVKKDGQMPFFGYVVLTHKFIHVVNWSAKSKSVEQLVALQDVVQIKTVTDEPSFTIVGSNQEQTRLFIYAKCQEEISTIELLFIQSYSRFPKWIQHMWLNSLMVDTTGERMTSVFKSQQVRLLDSHSCYDYLCRTIELIKSGQEELVPQMSFKFSQWMSEIPHFNQLIFRDSVIFDWLIKYLKETPIRRTEDVTLNLLNCLYLIVENALIDTDIHTGQLIMSVAATILHDIIYKLIEKPEKYFENCVGILFSMSILTVGNFYKSYADVIDQQTNTASIQGSDMLKLVKRVMDSCVAYLHKEQLEPPETVLVFKMMYSISQLTTVHPEVRDFLVRKYQDDFRYFASLPKLSVKVQPFLFKTQFLIFFEQFENSILNKKLTF
ncbi:hypothetical protein CHUAL_002924 [Chamberlinius hualienensis]